MSWICMWECSKCVLTHACSDKRDSNDGSSLTCCKYAGQFGEWKGNEKKQMKEAIV